LPTRPRTPLSPPGSGQYRGAPILLFAALLLVPLAPGAAGAAGGSHSQPIRIGVLAPLSGPYASGGSLFVQAATLAVERANSDGGVLGRRVELVVADTQGRVDIAKSETLRLVSREQVFALVGAYLSEETVGVVEAAAAAKKIVVVPVAATAEITDRVKRNYNRYRYVFRVGYSIPQWAGMLAEFLREKKIRKYAFVGAGIRWNRELALALRKSFGRPAYEAFYSPSNPVFEPIAVGAAASAPEILVLADPGKNSVAFVKRLREGNAPIPLLSVGGTLGDARVAATLPLDPPLYVQAAAWEGASDEATWYFQTFEKRYGYPPVGYSDTLPYDAVTVLLSAIRAARRAETGVVVDALERGAFPGVAGKYRFDSSHQAIWGLGSSPLHGTVVQWEKDGARIVFPAPKTPR